MALLPFAHQSHRARRLLLVYRLRRRKMMAVRSSSVLLRALPRTISSPRRAPTSCSQQQQQQRRTLQLVPRTPMRTAAAAPAPGAGAGAGAVRLSNTSATSKADGDAPVAPPWRCEDTERERHARHTLWMPFILFDTSKNLDCVCVGLRRDEVLEKHSLLGNMCFVLCGPQGPQNVGSVVGACTAVESSWTHSACKSAPGLVTQPLHPEM